MAEILAADIGGTNSRFAHFRMDGARLALVGSRWIETRSAASFGGLLESLYGGEGFSLSPANADAAVFAVAGPVERGGTYSNPPLIEFEIDLEAALPVKLPRALLINDFIAQAYACRSEVGRGAMSVIEGEARPDATIAVIGAGTGLGKAALVPDGAGGYSAMPSEGGHVAFAFMPGRETEYHEFLMKRTGHAYLTPNTVVSGQGLSLLHEFLTGDRLEPHKVTASFAAGESETLGWAARLYGRVARDFALDTLAMGGVFIAGGVAAKAPALVMHPAFREEFRLSPSHTELLSRIPVRLITDEQSGLWGAAYRASLMVGAL